jgi:hypothetical protein
MHKHSPCLKAWDGELGFELADEAGGVKPQLNAGSLAFKGGVAHRYEKCLKTLKLKRHF